MARLNVAAPQRARATLFPAIFTLALWRLRQTWRLLIVTGVGIVAAVVLVCVVPIFSQVAVTAGLRNALAADPANAQIGVAVATLQPSTAMAAQVQQQLDPVFQQSLGPYLTGGPDLTVSSQQFPIAARQNTTSSSGDSLHLVGVGVDHAAKHVTLIQGRLPQSQRANLEIAITPATADALHVLVGASLSLSTAAPGGQPSAKDQLKVHVVGIFDLLSGNDVFWHGHDFTPSASISNSPGQSNGTAYEALAANDALLTTLSTIHSTDGQGLNAPQNSTPELEWTYQLDVTKIDATKINEMNQQSSRLENRLHNALGYVTGIYSIAITGQAIAVLAQYAHQISTVAIPISIVLIQILGLVLLFVSMMADLLVERQSDAIAVLRSRGASRQHIIGALMTQSIGLGIIALVVGPFIAIVLVGFIAQRLLPANDSSALTPFTGHPVQAALSVGGYALVATAVAVLTMIIATSRASSLDVLATRREAARATRRPLWQRLNVDILFGVIGVAIYAAYIQATRTLGPTLVHALAILSLIAPLFLLVAGSLLFIRLFPLLLRVGERLATRGRRAAAMLALAQMARAPRQGLRTTLLLALALAFTIFTFIFTVSQAQRPYDVAAFQAGADFSGGLTTASAAAPSLATQTAAYRNIAGVTAAALGYRVTLPPALGTAHVAVSLVAVDADTFGDTAHWQQEAHDQPLTTIMRTLAAQRQSAVTTDTLPAYVDAATWNHLTLTNGAHFPLSVSGFNGGLHVVVVGVVQHIPGVYDDPQASPQTLAVTGAPGGAVLVDYQTYTAVLAHDLPGIVVPPNYAWLRTAGDAAALTRVRAALSSGPLRLYTLQDRRALIATMQADPLQIDLVGVLLIGAVAALVLALVGALISSWLSARSRLVSFAVLRALGTAPRQIAGVLLWEQGVIYLTAIVLGLALGTILTVLVLPTMVFSDTFDAGGSLPVYDVPPVQTIIPGLTLAVVVGGAMLVCVAVIALMTRITARPSIGQMLRLNED